MHNGKKFPIYFKQRVAIRLFHWIITLSFYIFTFPLQIYCMQRTKANTC